MLNLTPSPSLHLVAAVLFLALPLVASFKNCEVKADCNFVGCSDGAAFGLEYDCLECWNNCNTADQCCGETCWTNKICVVLEKTCEGDGKQRSGCPCMGGVQAEAINASNPCFDFVTQWPMNWTPFIIAGVIIQCLSCSFWGQYAVRRWILPNFRGDASMQKSRPLVKDVGYDMGGGDMSYNVAPQPTAPPPNPPTPGFGGAQQGQQQGFYGQQPYGQPGPQFGQAAPMYGQPPGYGQV